MHPPTRIAVALAATAALIGTGCGGDDEDASGGSAAKPKAKPKAGACRTVDAPSPKRVKLRNPKRTLESTDKLTAVVKTSCGSFEISLDAKRSPKTGGSFAFLVEKGFFDKTTFHRIVPSFVIQGGDPQGDGTGGPGYSVVEAPPQSIAYTRGVVAMAKTGAEPPGTSGSQFYVVTAADAGLPPDYAFLGKVTKGLDVVSRIEKLGDPASGQAGTPKRTVLIEEVTLRKG